MSPPTNPSSDAGAGARRRPVAQLAIDPAEVSADNAAGYISRHQFELIKLGVELVVPVVWPADLAVQVGVRALTREQLVLARAQAKQDTNEYSPASKSRGDDEEEVQRGDRDILDLCFRDLVVASAFVELDPARRGADGTWQSYSLRPDEVPVPLFPTVNDLRTRCASIVIEELFKLYAAHEALILPISSADDDKRVSALVEHLKKEPGSPVLNILPPAMLVAVVRTLVSAPREP